MLSPFLRTRWAALSSAVAVEVGGSSVQSAVLVEAWRELGYDRRPDASSNDAEALAVAIRTVDLRAGVTVVFGGGLARSYPDLVRRLAAVVGELRVEASAAPSEAKSAAYLGVLDRLAR